MRSSATAVFEPTWLMPVAAGHRIAPPCNGLRPGRSMGFRVIRPLRPRPAVTPSDRSRAAAPVKRTPLIPRVSWRAPYRPVSIATEPPNHASGFACPFSINSCSSSRSVGFTSAGQCAMAQILDRLGDLAGCDGQVLVRRRVNRESTKDLLESVRPSAEAATQEHLFIGSGGVLRAVTETRAQSLRIR